jgi:hypothetical protein
MRKQINPNIKAHLTRSVFYVLVLLLPVCMIPFVLAQRTGSKRIVTKVTSASRRLLRVGNVLPANIVLVTNTNDSGSRSLRDALAIANDGDTIDATGISGTILLLSGELQINHNVTINGPGAGNLAVNGNATFRVFENFASDVTISSFTSRMVSPPLAITTEGVAPRRPHTHRHQYPQQQCRGL